MITASVLKGLNQKKKKTLNNERLFLVMNINIVKTFLTEIERMSVCGDNKRSNIFYSAIISEPLYLAKNTSNQATFVLLVTTFLREGYTVKFFFQGIS